MKSKTKCIKSARSGRWKISLLEITKTFQQPENVRDVFPERTRVEDRVAVQYSKKVNGEWKNETIFCSAQDFANLQNAIEDFHDNDVGDNSPSSDRGEI